LGFHHFLADWKPHNESGSLFAALCGNRPSMPVNNFSTDSQPHANSGIFISSVEALEGLEDFVQILLIEPYPVIFHKDAD
jgi:hypothetical protein